MSATAPRETITDEAPVGTDVDVPAGADEAGEDLNPWAAVMPGGVALQVKDRDFDDDDGFFTDPSTPVLPVPGRALPASRPRPQAPAGTASATGAGSAPSAPVEGEGSGAVPGAGSVPGSEGGSRSRLPSGPRGPRPAWLPQTVEGVPSPGAGTQGLPVDPAPAPSTPLTLVPPVEETAAPASVTVDDVADSAGVPLVVNPATGEVLPAPAAGADPVSVTVPPAAPVASPTQAAPVTAPAPVVVPASVQPSLPGVDPVDLFPGDGDEEWVEPEEDMLPEPEPAKVKITKIHRPINVTSRDVAMLQFLGRYKYATYPQLSRAFDMSLTALRQRMPRLAREGLVVRKNAGKANLGTGSAHSVWLATLDGLRVADIDLPVATVNWGAVAHTLGLVDIGIILEAKGETVVTEREIRAADTRERPSERMLAAMRSDVSTSVDTGRAAGGYVVPLGAADTGYGHIPDMALVRDRNPDGTPNSVAIELELNKKKGDQWRKILRAYKKSQNFANVVYFTHEAAIRNGILKAAAEVGAGDIVTVRKFIANEDNPGAVQPAK